MKLFPPLDCGLSSLDPPKLIRGSVKVKMVSKDDIIVLISSCIETQDSTI